MQHRDSIVWDNAPLSVQPLPAHLLEVARATIAIAAPSATSDMAFHGFAPGQVLAFEPGRARFVAFERGAGADAGSHQDAVDGMRLAGHPSFSTKKICHGYRAMFARAFIRGAPDDIRARMREAAPGRDRPVVTIWLTAADALAHLFRRQTTHAQAPVPAPVAVRAPVQAPVETTRHPQPFAGVVTIYDAVMRTAASTGRRYLSATATGRVTSAEPFVFLVFAPECIDALQPALDMHGPLQAAVAGRWDKGAFIANEVSTDRHGPMPVAATRQVAQSRPAIKKRHPAMRTRPVAAVDATPPDRTAVIPTALAAWTSQPRTRVRDGSALG